MKAFLQGIGKRLQRSKLWGTVAGVVIGIMFDLEWENVVLIGSTLGLYMITQGSVDKAEAQNKV